MKILQVVSMGYVCGGAEKSVLMLRDGLRGRGHEVRVLSSNRDPEQPHFSDYECEGIKSGIFRHLWNHSAYRTLKAAIADFKPDVVHFHTMGELSPSVLFALGGTPALLTVHGPEEYTRTMINWYLEPHVFKNGDIAGQKLTPVGRLQRFFFANIQRPLYVLGFKKLRRIVAPSGYLLELLEQEHYPVPLRHIYNGILLPSRQPLHNEPTLLYVGRLEQVKGVEVLIRSMPKVLEDKPDAMLHIVGDGPDRRRLERLVVDLKIATSVVFCGWLNGDAVQRQFASCRIVIIPSVWPENLPTVAIEALATGRPIVGSRVGGIPELIKDGLNGTIVTPGNVQELANATAAVLKDPNFVQKSDVARAQAERLFSLDTFLNTIEELYGEVIA